MGLATCPRKLKRSGIKRLLERALWEQGLRIALFSLFVVGYDTGQIFSVVQGKSAYDTMWLHEFVHDIRHESGFPCH